jgi:hypothetical protein
MIKKNVFFMLHQKLFSSDSDSKVPPPPQKKRILSHVVTNRKITKRGTVPFLL